MKQAFVGFQVALFFLLMSLGTAVKAEQCPSFTNACPIIPAGFVCPDGSGTCLCNEKTPAYAGTMIPLMVPHSTYVRCAYKVSMPETGPAIAYITTSEFGTWIPTTKSHWRKIREIGLGRVWECTQAEASQCQFQQIQSLDAR